MAKRPAGIHAFVKALKVHRVDVDRYAAFNKPVYYSWGDRSHPRWRAMRDRLATLFPDFRDELYVGLHHLNTSHQAMPDRVARSLERVWARAK
jgi:hypothetical protein